jgi:hypothetical protein
MSWLLVSFAIVLGALVVGWLAYERSRPSARMVAVVATLAAVAALGRDAFVALPDVKPITAMTLVVGYALGPLAGFAVGSVGMLASNVMLGQGPYTPWQMVAWGLVGVAGAAFARLTGRRAGRLPLALACALSALAAKEIMNLYTWTVGASHTPAALLADAAIALPFDLTDTVASLLFGLAFAPELARLLARLRARMEVEWKPAGPSAAVPMLLAACALAASTLATSAHAQRSGGEPSVRARVSRSTSPSLAPELGYLARAQNRDGGFGAAAGRPSSELFSAWAAIGLAASGRSARVLARDGRTVLDAIRAQAATLEGVGDVERTILALRACGASLAAFPGDLLGRLMASRAPDGSFGRLVNITAFAVFALRASGRPASDPAVRAAGRWLAAQQDPDGGFGFSGRGGGEDVDDTAAALQGVIDAGGRGGPVLARAVGFLRRAQNPDGGFPQQSGGESNAQSTAWAVQGLIAAGQDVSALKRAGSRTPLAYLQSLLAPDGSVRYSRTSAQTPVWVTAQALTALAGRPFPIEPPPTRRPGPKGRARGRAGGVPGAKSVRRSQAPSAPKQGPLVPRAAISEDALAREAGIVIGLVLFPTLR